PGEKTRSLTPSAACSMADKSASVARASAPSGNSKDSGIGAIPGAAMFSKRLTAIGGGLERCGDTNNLMWRGVQRDTTKNVMVMHLRNGQSGNRSLIASSS